MIVPQPGRRDWDHWVGLEIHLMRRDMGDRRKWEAYYATIRCDAREQHNHAVCANVDFRICFTHWQRMNRFCEQLLRKQIITYTKCQSQSLPLTPFYTQQTTHPPKMAQTTAQLQNHSP
jgi:hypothetical protein